MVVMTIYEEGIDEQTYQGEHVMCPHANGDECDMTLAATMLG